MIKNDLILRTLRGEETERCPVWLMRQAGRVLPEYRATRSKAKDFLSFVKSPELAAEVTLQPVDILGVDAAIIFSDILVVPEAMGFPYTMVESQGPRFTKTIGCEQDVKDLKISDANELGYVLRAIQLSKKEIGNRVPLIGFCGAPWTILAYLAEGSGSKTFSKAKNLIYSKPALAHEVLSKITKTSIHYLNAQVEAGADIIQIFDSWAGVLTPEMYREFSLRYIEEICDEIQKKVPVIVFAKDAHFALKDIDKIKCSGIGLDWTIDPASARRMLSPGRILQGNADPCLLYANELKIKSDTKKMLDGFGKNHHIANLGHGLYPDLPLEKVKYFISCVKSHTYEPQLTS